MYTTFKETIILSANFLDIELIKISVSNQDSSIYMWNKQGDYTRNLTIKTITITQKNEQLCIDYYGQMEHSKVDNWKKFIQTQWKLAQKIKNSDYQLKARDLLLYTSKTLASSYRFKEVLQNILINTLEVIEAADAGSIYLFDDSENVLIPQVSAGFNWEYIRHIRIEPGESISGITFKRKKPFIFHQSKDVYKAMETMSQQNRYFFDMAVKGISNEEKSRSAMCSPFLLKGKCLGVISINSFLSNVEFHKEDLELLEAICNQSAVAIERVNLFHEVENRVNELKRLNEMMEKKNNELEYTHKTHTQLTQIVLQQKGMHEIGNEISKMLGKPIVIYDEYLHTLTTPDEPKDLGFEVEIPSFLDVLNQVKEQKSSISLKPSEKYPIDFPVHMVPIITSNQVKGFLLIVEKDQSLNRLERKTVEQICTVIALELLKHEAVQEMKQRLKGEFLDDIQSNVNIELIQKQASYLGIHENLRYSFISIEVDEIHQKSIDQVQLIKQMQYMVERVVQQHTPDSLLFNRFNSVKILAAWSKFTDEEVAIEKAKKLIKELNTVLNQYFPEFTFSYAIGRVVDQLKGLYHSYNDMKECIDIIKKRNLPKQILTYKEIGPAKIILKSSSEELYQFVMDLLKPMINYEHQIRDDLITTLDCYLVNNQNIKQTAQVLHLHLNTINYRLKRIEQILNIDFKASSHFFNLQLAWSIMEHLGTKKEWLKI